MASAYKPCDHCDAPPHAIFGSCYFGLAAIPCPQPVFVAVQFFDKIPGATSDDQGNQRRKDEVAHGLSASIQLLEVHPVNRGSEVQGHIDKGEDGD